MPEITEVKEWYLRARHRYVWDGRTIADYSDVINELVRDMIEELGYPSEVSNSLLSPDIGTFKVVDEDSEERWLCILYIADRRPWDIKKNTLFSFFKHAYRIAVGSDELWMGAFSSPDMLRQIFPHAPDARIQMMQERASLVRHFKSLANKSLNHRRAISTRVRFQVLQRDKSTCRICGRRAPEVRLHVDHIEPVSWGKDLFSLCMDWQPSDNPDDYQILCEDCNLGRGDMSWLFTR